MILDETLESTQVSSFHVPDIGSKPVMRYIRPPSLQELHFPGLADEKPGGHGSELAHPKSFMEEKRKARALFLDINIIHFPMIVDTSPFKYLLESHCFICFTAICSFWQGTMSYNSLSAPLN